MISERPFTKGFKGLEQAVDADCFGGQRIQGLGDSPILWQCFEPARRRFGIAIRIPQGEAAPDHLPPDTDKAIVTIIESKDDGSLLLFAQGVHCKEKTFIALARLVANHYEAERDYSAAGFLAAVEEYMHAAKAPPPFPYEKQAGLMGELFVLENDLMRVYSRRAAIAYWLGPFGNAKDFVLPCCCIEVKATKASEEHSFWVSNDDQFLVPEDRPMFLRFITFNENQSDSETVADVVQRIRGTLATEPGLDDQFVKAVKKAGYNPKHRKRYKKLARFTRAGDFYFRVDRLFPQLQLAQIQRALSVEFLAAIKYSIAVGALRKDFEVQRPPYMAVLASGVGA